MVKNGSMVIISHCSGATRIVFQSSSSRILGGPVLGKHLVNVMLGTTDLIVIKEEGGAIDDGKMICAFNQYKFFRPNDIHSGPSDGKVYDAYKYSNYQMIITTQSIKFYKRGSRWFNYMGWSFGPGSDFHNYLNSIFNDHENYLNQFLIRYTPNIV